MAYSYSFNKVWDKITYACGACGLIAISLGYAIAGLGWWWFIFALAAAVITGWLFVGWIRDARNYIRGMQGELRVEAMLSLLPEEEYWYENDVVLGDAKWNIDHMVVGPNGIWTIETKNHVGDVRFIQGKLLRGNREFPEKELAQARGQAFSLQEYLSKKGCRVAWVQSIIAVANIDALVRVPDAQDKTLIVGYRDVVEKIMADASGGKLDEIERRKIKEVMNGLRKENEAREKMKDRRETWLVGLYLVACSAFVVFASWLLGQLRAK